VRIVLASEVYPPRAGGAGWSTRALALSLRAAGHQVSIVTTSPGPTDLDGLAVTRLTVSGRKRLRVPRVFAAHLAAHADAVVHAQHSLSALGALAGREPRRVAVTVRDHWPVCFWSTRISGGALCPGCGLRAMTRCVHGHVRPDALAWGAIPYMQADLLLKRRALGRAGATLAVSEAIAGELRAAGVPRVETIPNIVDAEEAAAVARDAPSFELPERFVVFVGKLEENKGARHLVPAIAAHARARRQDGRRGGRGAAAAARLGRARGRPAHSGPGDSARLPLALARAAVARAAGGAGTRRSGGGDGDGRHHRDPGTRRRPPGA
jgi:glycogen synthase